MKTLKKYHILIAIVGITTLASCKKFLDFQSPSALNIEQTFATADNAGNEILGIYNKVAGRSAYGDNLAFVHCVGTDESSAQGTASFDPTQNYAISNYGENTQAASLYDTFTQLYAGVERANIAIKYIPQSPVFNGTDKAVMHRYLGEALALRAVFYYELIKNWGDVPAIFVPSADLPTQFMTNANRDSTYDHILNDLQLAETYVGWRSELPDYVTFRLTKGAIKALRARIALSAGGYSLHVTTMSRRADYQKFYKIAFDECNDVILSNQHALNPVYENIFKTLHTSPTRYDDAHELMFEIAMWGGFNDSDLSRTFGTYFNVSTTWGKAGGGPNALPTYFYAFQNGTDSRRDVTCSTYVVGAGEVKTVATLTNFNIAKFRKSWTQFTAQSTSLVFGVNWPVIRYADVLLMYAEAGNELGLNGVITPLQALQLVQRRAYGTNPIPVTPSDKDGFFNAIVNERLLEFGGEGLRKNDLIRWNMLASKLAETKAKLPFLAMNAPTTNNPYTYVPDIVYYLQTVPFKNLSCTAEEAGMPYYGGTNNVAFYTPNTAVPSGYKTVNWRKQVGTWTNGVLTSTFINDPNVGYVCKFQENKSELLPYPQKVIIENRGAIVQNYGYSN